MMKNNAKQEKTQEEYFLGIDIGSTTFKAVLMTGHGKVKHSLYVRTKPVDTGRITCSSRCAECGSCNMGALKKTMDEFLAGAGIDFKDVSCTVVTGSQVVDETKRFIDYDFQVSEVSAHVAGAKHYYPDCKAILDVGGQDSKAMLFNDDMQMWTYRMSGICAAGTGAFLDSVALKLNVPVEEMADKVNYDSNLEFSSVCAVLSATSINKFKNRFPLGEVIGGACRAQARTVLSGVGELLFNYKGDIVFQGGVASNRAVAYYLKEITGNNIIIPEFHCVMGALGAACLATKYASIKNNLDIRKPEFDRTKLKSLQMRAKLTKQEFLSSHKTDQPLVWRNLFFPTEILNAMDLKMLTLETYAALFARNTKKTKKAFDEAAYKGFSAETCSFLRLLEGIPLPKPDYALSTSEPCQQGERIFADLSRSYGFQDKFYSLHTPIEHDEKSVEAIAQGLDHAVGLLEKNLGRKLDMGRLAEACDLSNQAREISQKCNDLRFSSPPLIKGSLAIYYSVVFSQLWGKKELVDLQTLFYNELLEQKHIVEKEFSIDDTHRILWLHLPPFYDRKLLEHVEETCNAPIVFEEVNFVDWAPLDPKDPYRSLARKLLTVGFLDPKLRVKYIKENSQIAKFNGCILYNHGFGRCSLADSCLAKHLREELKEIHMPLLQLDGDCMDPTIDPCSTFTKVSSYIEALNEKKYGNIFGPVDMNRKTNVLSKNMNKIIEFGKKVSTDVKGG